MNLTMNAVKQALNITITTEYFMRIFYDNVT